MGEHKAYSVYFGTALGANAYPWIVFTPLKVSSVWFPSNQRNLETTICIMGNPLGVMFVNIVSLAIVSSPEDLKLTIFIDGIPAVIGMIITFVFVRRNAPLFPSSAISVKKEMPYWKGMK
uniref:MFS domain-containing protein n=1 Tax=Strongyloides papillosus TaxID=174720 RepID=A0A0N5C696_STREA